MGRDVAGTGEVPHLEVGVVRWSTENMEVRGESF